MRLLRSALLAVLAASFVWLALLVLAQQAPPPSTEEQEAAAAKAKQMEELTAIVQKQFGDFEISATRTEGGFRYLHPDKKKEASWRYFVTGDLNGDGVEDAVIVVRYKNPLAGQGGFNYKVLDPYFSAHGYGDPKVTAEFQSEDPRDQNMLLVIHGAGPEAWRAETPKEKFVLINLPFDRVSIAPVLVKKKKMMGILAEEDPGGASTVYWDGKKYKWVGTTGIEP